MYYLPVSGILDNAQPIEIKPFLAHFHINNSPKSRWIYTNLIHNITIMHTNIIISIVQFIHLTMLHYTHNNKIINYSPNTPNVNTGL
jgi:hypothetical protein